MKRYKILHHLTLPYILRLAIIAVVYYISGKLGLQLAFANPSATAIWPPTGIALAVYLVFGYRVLPAIFIGAFFVNVTTSGTILTSLGIALGNTLEGLLGAFLVNKYANGTKAFESVRGVFNFTMYAGLLSTMVSATIGVTTLLLGGFTNLAQYYSVWTTWWLGDISGALIIAPLLILWLTSKSFPWKFKNIAETLLLLCALIFVSEIVFTGPFHFTYLCIPILLWASLRLSPREAATAVFFVALIATINTLNGLGPFIADGRDLENALLFLQLYMATIAITTLIIAAIVIERDKDQEALKNSEKRFRALIDKSNDAISLLDTQGVTIYASPSAEKVLGFTPEELEGTNAFGLIHPDDLKYTTEIFAKLLAQPGGNRNAEFRIKRKDGAWRWLEATGTNLLHDSNVKAVVINYRDITERREIEEEIQQEKADDEALLGSIGEGIVAVDKEGKITLINKAFEEFIGWKQKEVLGKHPSDILGMQDENGNLIPEKERPLVLAMTTKKKVITTHYLTRKDKTKFPALIIASPVILDGKLRGGIKVFHDITQEKEIDRAKTELVSLASHQLKTPLATINWYIELLFNKQAENLSEKQKEYLLEVYHASQRMVELINALLTISRLELGTFNIDVQKVNLVALIKQALTDLKPQITQKKIEIVETYSIENSVKYIMESEPKFLAIIIQNILTNAIKYTRENGKVAINVSPANSNTSLLVTFKDDGYGIPKSEQSKIFSKLFRASNIKVVDQQGTGLGLYIVKSMIDQLNGKVWFKSEENKGTTFYISLPLHYKKRQKKQS